MKKPGELHLRKNAELFITYHGLEEFYNPDYRRFELRAVMETREGKGMLLSALDVRDFLQYGDDPTANPLAVPLMRRKFLAHERDELKVAKHALEYQGLVKATTPTEEYKGPSDDFNAKIFPRKVVATTSATFDRCLKP